MNLGIDRKRKQFTWRKKLYLFKNKFILRLFYVIYFKYFLKNLLSTTKNFNE